MHKRPKHIDTKFHIVREKLEDKVVELVYTINWSTDQLAADVLTKALPHVKVGQHRQMLRGKKQIFLLNFGTIWVGALKKS